MTSGIFYSNIKLEIGYMLEILRALDTLEYLLVH